MQEQGDKMKQEIGTFIVGLVVGIILGFLIGSIVMMHEKQDMFAETECARYNPDTAKFEFIQKEN